MKIQHNQSKNNPNYLGYDEDYNGNFDHFYRCPNCGNNYIRYSDKRCNICIKTIEWVGFPEYSITSLIPSLKQVSYLDSAQEFLNGVSIKFSQELEECIVEGLTRKGFVFDTRNELRDFVKEFCKCEDNTQLKQKVYYVNNTPFMLFNYMPTLINEKDTLSVFRGSYKYL